MDLSKKSSANADLKVHEWLAITVISALIFGVAAISTYNAHRMEVSPLDPAIAHTKNSFEVLIKGAVEYPGVYRLNSAMTMREFLALATPRKDANLQRYNMDKKITKGRTLNIPSKSLITIRMEGAVKQVGELQVVKTTRLMDLIEMVEWDEFADTRVLNKKRKIKPGETIVVPRLPRS